MATRATTYQTPANTGDRRGFARHRMSPTRASIWGTDAVAAEALLHDLSIYGCRLETAARHDMGDRVFIRLGDDLPVAASVMWNIDGRLACRFDQPIARATMRSVTLRLV